MPYRRIACLFLLLAWGGAGSAQTLSQLAAITGGSSDSPPAPWRVLGFPHKSAQKPVTQFDVVALDGERALRIRTDRSYGNLVHEWSGPLPGQLAWRWRLDQPLQNTDIRTKAGDDSALKVCVLFDEPLGRVPLLERTLLRVERAATGENLPAATLCYLWDSKYPAGTTGSNAFTRRLRYIVLQGPQAPLALWTAQARDVAQDFLQLFGDENPQVPPVLGVLVGADADNTQGQSLAYLRDLRWLP